MTRTLSLLTAALFTVASAQDTTAPAPALPPTTQAAPAAAPGLPVRAQVTSGLLVGREAGGVRVWQGIPYAAPPVGERRWKAPEPAPIWVGERDASRPGNVCVQPRPPLAGGGLRGAEDCLYLNVYAPANAARAPVMVWIHGGSFRSGAGSDYDGRVLARERGVVVVTVNYRLGPLGFLAAPGLLEGRTDGNYGLLDQQAALRWVRANAAAFGGDPANVTVFGESAGGMSLCAQLASPGAAGLFDKAVLQSGPCTPSINIAALPDALNTGAAYARDLGCPDGSGACLRGVPVERLLTTPVPGRRAPGSVALPPVYGDAVLPRSPHEVFQSGEVNRVPVMIGSNLDEGTLFVAPIAGAGRDLPLWQYWGLVALLERWNAPRVLANYLTRDYPTVGLTAAAVVTDGLFACPVNDITRDLARVVPVYAYEFRDQAAPSELKPTTSVPRYGAFHAAELISVFGTPLTDFADPAQFTPAQADLARTLRTYWTNFARTGNPNGPGLPVWRPFVPAQNNVLTFQPGNIHELTDFRQEHRCDVWDH
ncbi:carboxylesterase family protein [Deinococcus metallilatus]|uniref:Carboxylic ester hydrolase n=1 Tax=Deinococcus metallilatus TaxID=1211322 RepID=A0AAJ5F155_9DEIO|nr:carboxylesterase/lipase family protein [Deinococcus metallilatus]MBB5296165.1 para-nitrobenzyl esterase [Deinococcus metallilatus]QBY09785.1 carboxylesterase family protein [Deinococcus metallilatus]RXJ08983.1 carboxylesterase family protein [Deinococcus metallilatus]TLK23638.1 carboxylesterase family protein [Deinococcus metallilatus]GMA14031.1 carboxylic ester hydrolase [Deinococcus metallilatus]